MTNVLLDLRTRAVAFLRIQDVPEDAEPLVEKAAVGLRGGERGRRKILRALPIDVILGIGIHRIVSETVGGYITVLVPNFSLVLLYIELRVAVQDGPGTIVHLKPFWPATNVSKEENRDR